MFEVYDRINRESILSGSREECNEYIAPLPQYLEYVVREKPTEAQYQMMQARSNAWKHWMSHGYNRRDLL